MRQDFNVQLDQELSVKQQTVVQMRLLACPMEELSACIQSYTENEPLIEIEEPVFEESPDEIQTNMILPWEGWGTTSASDQRKSEFEEFTSIPFQPSLREIVLDQIRCIKMSDLCRKALMYLVDELSPDGYLPSLILSEAEHSFPEIKTALNVLQTLEPSGVGARSVSECLEIQLRQLNCFDRTYRMLLEYLPDLAQKNYQKLSKNLRISVDEVKSRHTVILSLNPKPGAIYSSDHTVYIFPDVTVFFQDGGIQIRYNRRCRIRTVVRDEYKAMLNNPSQSSELKKYIRTNVQKSSWLNRCIEQREKVVCQVCNEIILQQHSFFFECTGTITPMTLKTIAQKLNVSISTVSRACAGKYMQTPLGTFSFGYFFSHAVGEETADVSANTIQRLLLNIVNSEDSAAPYSDQQLCQLLQEQHQIQVSRRTIAKYRVQLHIADSKKRKTR